MAQRSEISAEALCLGGTWTGRRSRARGEGLSRRSRRAMAGMTLLEVILGLSILALVTIGLNQLADRWADDTKDTVAASQVRTFGEAVKSYIKDNYAAVQGVATATTPAIIDVPTLIAAQKLPAGYQNSNAFGQATCALVLQPTANRLQAMVITEGGQTMGDPSLATVAATVGGSGGGVYSTDPVTIKGAVGGWQIGLGTYENLPNNLGKRCNGSAGNVRLTPGHPMMALWFENGDVSSAFLARDAVPGRPELNAMNTPLMMNSVQTMGAACTTGAIARASDGSLLTCRTGSWQPASAACLMDGSTDLNNLQDDSRCINGVGNPNSPAGGDWFFLEVFRHVNHGIYYVTQRAIGMTGASIGRTWIRSQNSGAQAGGWTTWNQVSDPGVTTTNGSVATTGSVNAGSSVTAAQNVVANGTVLGSYIYSTGDMAAAGNVNAGQNVNAGWRVTAGENVSAGQFVTAGQGMYSNGRVQTQTSGDWAVVTTDGGGGLYTAATSAIGSMHVNDIWLRSANQWISQMLKPKSYAISWYPGICSGCSATIAPNWYVGGTPLAIHGTSKNYGGGNCEGGTQYQLRDIYGNVIRGWTWLAGTNVGSGNDGGSGMWDVHPFTIFMANNAYYVDFYGTGCWGAQVEVQGLMMQ